MKTVSRPIFYLFVLLVSVSMACNAGGTNTPQGNVPPINIPQEGVPQATLDAANTRAAEIANEAANAAATAQASAAQVATQVVPASETVAAGVELVATSLPTLEAAATLVAPTLAAADYTMDDLDALFSTVQPDGNGSISVTMTDDQLNAAIAAGQSTGQGSGQIQNVSFTFVPGAIVMTGDVTQPVQASLSVTFAPYVSNGVLQFDITQASLGNIQVPPATLDQAEVALNSTLGKAVTQLPANVTLQSVTVGDGVMTFVAGVN